MNGGEPEPRLAIKALTALSASHACAVLRNKTAHNVDKPTQQFRILHAPQTCTDFSRPQFDPARCLFSPGCLNSHPARSTKLTCSDCSCKARSLPNSTSVACWGSKARTPGQLHEPVQVARVVTQFALIANCVPGMPWRSLMQSPPNKNAASRNRRLTQAAPSEGSNSIASVTTPTISAR